MEARILEETRETRPAPDWPNPNTGRHLRAVPETHARVPERVPAQAPTQVSVPAPVRDRAAEVYRFPTYRRRLRQNAERRQRVRRGFVTRFVRWASISLGVFLAANQAALIYDQLVAAGGLGLAFGLFVAADRLFGR